MSYLNQSLLEVDVHFGARTRAVITQQSLVFRDSQLAQLRATAFALLRSDPGPSSTFVRMLAGAPGFADNVDDGNGGIDSSKLSDDELLSATQSDFPVLASLFFDEGGSPITGQGETS